MSNNHQQMKEKSVCKRCCVPCVYLKSTRTGTFLKAGIKRMGGAAENLADFLLTDSQFGLFMPDS